MVRMLGDVAQSWCPSCHCPPGPDCPDVGKSTRAVKRRERREVGREIDDLVAEWHAGGEAALHANNRMLIVSPVTGEKQNPDS